ncbi:putative F-box protein [Abeliophyllum distichum]|uniref:F-box protein n=1 Tax=Abeliophyllum distichum TaxID=126358 RepID=A0ABD1SJZ3_9LAMI
MSSEASFQTIQVPDGVRSKSWELSVCNGYIALLLKDREEVDTSIDIDIWLMKDKECWIKHLTVGPFCGIRWPLGFWRNNELLLETGASPLILYNPNTNEFTSLGIQRKDNASFSFWVFAYKESLVLIDESSVHWGCSTYSNIFPDFFNIR